MWEQISSNCLRYLRDLLGGLFGWLFFLAFLAGVIEEGSFECFGDEVSIDPVFIDAGGG